MATIIQVWTQNAKRLYPDDPDYITFVGLGDLIRGSIGLYRLSKRLGCDFIVDFSLHPISNFLQVKKHKYSNLIAKQETIYAIDWNRVMPYIYDKFQNDDYAIFATNGCLDLYDEPSTDDLQKFIKDILIPNDNFKKYIDEQFNKLPYKNYNIMHFRLGDKEFFRNEGIEKYNQVLKIIEKENNNSDNTILLSDSIIFKHLVKHCTDIFMYMDNIGHIGAHKDLNAIKFTLFEFLLLIKADSIKTYTIYPWTSGFVKIANYIYNIPLIEIKNEN
jgi:hypothetical protein